MNKNDKFANEVSGAAQWQLVKEDNKRTIIERSFVYNKDGRVTVQARGDKLMPMFIDCSISMMALKPRNTSRQEVLTCLPKRN